MRPSQSSRYQALPPLRAPKCVKGVPCGSVCISKGEECHAKRLAFDDGDPQEYARGFHEYFAAQFSGFHHPRTGKTDIAGFRSLPEAQQRAALKEAHRFIENGLVDGTGIDKHHERIVDAMSAGYDEEYPQGLGTVYVKTKVKPKRRKDSSVNSCNCGKCDRKRRDAEVLTRLDRQSPGKCGKGWKSGPGGKCVRKPRRSGMVGLGLAATGAAAIGGAVAGGIAVMRQKKGKSSEAGRLALPTGGMRGGGAAIVPYSATAWKNSPGKNSGGQTPLLTGQSNAAKLLPPAGGSKKGITGDDIRSALKKGLKRLPSREKLMRPQNMVSRLPPALKKARNANSVIEETWRRVKPRRSS